MSLAILPAARSPTATAAPASTGFARPCLSETRPGGEGVGAFIKPRAAASRAGRSAAKATKRRKMCGCTRKATSWGHGRRGRRFVRRQARVVSTCTPPAPLFERAQPPRRRAAPPPPALRRGARPQRGSQSAPLCASLSNKGRIYMTAGERGAYICASAESSAGALYGLSWCRRSASPAVTSPPVLSTAVRRY